MRGLKDDLDFIYLVIAIGIGWSFLKAFLA